MSADLAGRLAAYAARRLPGASEVQVEGLEEDARWLGYPFFVMQED